MKKFETELKNYIEKLKSENLFDNLPLHSMIPYLPVVGQNYGKRKKVFFIGQDANHVKLDHDNQIEKEKELFILSNYEENSAFNFDDENFLDWFSVSSYYFWEFPIRFINLTYGFGNEILDVNSDNIFDHPDLMYAYQTFGWGNLGPIVFPHVLFNRIYRNDKTIKGKANYELYCKAFNIARQSFSTLKFYLKYFEPDLIVILSKRFDKNSFFEDLPYTLVFNDNHNFINQYIVEISNKNIQIISTYHPSYMRRLEYQGEMGITDYVKTIYTLTTKF